MNNRIRLNSLGIYQAPSNCSPKPSTIPEHQECIELIIKGQIYYNLDGKEILCGRGSLFWHLPGEHTIHRNVLTNPYSCVYLTFQHQVQPQRTVLKYSRWDNELEMSVDQHSRAHIWR